MPDTVTTEAHHSATSIEDRITAWAKYECFSGYEFILLAAIGIVANAYFITNYSLSIDDELAALRTNASVWVAQGRFTAYAVERLLFPQPSVPYSPYLFLVACQVAAFALIVRVHGFSINWKTYATFPLMITFPTWWLISEFSANVPSTGIGFLLVSAAVYMTFAGRTKALFTRISATRLVLAATLLALSAGAYQSFFLVFFAMSTGVLLVRVSRSTDSERMVLIGTSKQLVQAGVCVILGAALFEILGNGAQLVLGVHPEYISTFIRPENFSNTLGLVKSIVKLALTVYSGSAVHYGSFLWLSGPVVVLGACCATIDSSKSFAIKLVLVGALLGSPFLLHIVADSSLLPMRSMLALAYVTWLLAMTILANQSLVLVRLGVVMLSLFQLQVINLTSQYIAAATLTQSLDRSIASDVGRHLEELASGDDSNAPIKLDVYGFRPWRHTLVHHTAPNGVTTGSFFGWDYNSIQRISGYLILLGYSRVEALPDADRLAMTPEFAGMGVWPQASSMRRVGDRYLLKLGEEADKAHTAPERK